MFKLKGNSRQLIEIDVTVAGKIYTCSCLPAKGLQKLKLQKEHAQTNNCSWNDKYKSGISKKIQETSNNKTSLYQLLRRNFI